MQALCASAGFIRNTHPGPPTKNGFCHICIFLLLPPTRSKDWRWVLVALIKNFRLRGKEGDEAAAADEEEECVFLAVCQSSAGAITAWKSHWTKPVCLAAAAAVATDLSWNPASDERAAVRCLLLLLNGALSQLIYRWSWVCWEAVVVAAQQAS